MLFITLFVFSTTSGKQLSKVVDEPGEFSLTKRSVDFMGQRVSYPQYLRLVAIQREVIRMDRTIRAMLNIYDPIQLAKNPYWMELVELYDSLKKMLPPEYLTAAGGKAFY